MFPDLKKLVRQFKARSFREGGFGTVRARAAFLLHGHWDGHQSDRRISVSGSD